MCYDRIALHNSAARNDTRNGAFGFHTCKTSAIKTPKGEGTSASACVVITNDVAAFALGRSWVEVYETQQQ